MNERNGLSRKIDVHGVTYRLFIANEEVSKKSFAFVGDLSGYLVLREIDDFFGHFENLTLQSILN